MPLFYKGLRGIYAFIISYNCSLISSFFKKRMVSKWHVIELLILKQELVSSFTADIG